MKIRQALVLVCFCSGLARGADGPYDLLILGGRVVDGTGNAWFLGDVAVVGDSITRVAPAGQLREAKARRTVDATGLVVCPGFIDIQGHSREELLSGDGRLVGKITQGVTTEILGEGESNAPSKKFDGPHGFAAWLSATYSTTRLLNLSCSAPARLSKMLW